MNKFFANNLPWKIVSLLFATLLWIFVINTQNPIQTREISNLPIDIKGLETIEEQGFVLQNEEEIRKMNFKVIVKGPRLEMETLMGTHPELEVRIDLTPYATTLTSVSTEKAVAVQIVGERGDLQIEEIKPRTISAIFAREETIQKDIYANIKGMNNNEYIAQDPILKPGTVEVMGTALNLEKVHRATVDIDIADFSEDVITYTLPINLLDEEGNPVEGVKSNPEEIEVVLPIGKKKQVPLQVQFRGNLPEGYIKSNTIITPEQIMVVGKSDSVDKLTHITLESITLDNMIQSDTFTINPVLPKGVERIDMNDIVVTVEIQKEIPYDYTIDTTELKLDVIGLPETYELYITQPTISVKLLGTAENLLEFNVKDVQAIIDLNKIGTVEPGLYSIPMAIEIPNNVRLLTGEGVPPTIIDIEIVDPNAVFDENEEDENLELEGSDENNTDEDNLEGENAEEETETPQAETDTSEEVEKPESESPEAEQSESDHSEVENQESDSQELESQEAENQQTNNQESEVPESDHLEVDNQESQGSQTENLESDNQESETQEQEETKTLASI